MITTEKLSPPLEQPLRDAEAAIAGLVAQPDAKWDLASDGWVVGGNVAETTTAVGKTGNIFVAQALGPKPTEQKAHYTAVTPVGTLSWREGVTDLKDVRRVPREGGGAWTSLELAQRGLGAVIAARPKPPQS